MTSFHKLTSITMLTFLIILTNCVYHGKGKKVSTSSGVYYIDEAKFTHEEVRHISEIDILEFSSIKIKNVTGDIVIRGWNKRKVAGKYVKRAASKKELDNTDIKLDYVHNEKNKQERLWIQAVLPKSRKASVTFELWVPKQAWLESIKSSFGDISINNIEGDVKAHTMSGNIDIENIEGNIDASGSSAVITGVTGTHIVKSLSGNIKVKQAILLGKSRIENVSGNIDLTISALKGPLYVDTMSGDVDIDLLNNSGALIEAHTSGGDISCKYVRIKTDFDESKEAFGSKEPAKHDLFVRTTSGDIDID